MIPAACPWGDELIEDMFRLLGSPAANGWSEVFFTRGGLDGDTSTQVKTRFLADTTRRNWNQTIWTPSDNSFNATTIKADIAAMIADIPHTRYVVMGAIPNGNNSPTEIGPSGSRYLEIVALNDDLRTLYGSKFYDTLEFLQFRGQAAGNSRSITNFVASSVDQPTNIHLIAAAYNALLADLNTFATRLGYRSTSAGDEQTDLAGSRRPVRIVPTITSTNTGTVAEHREFTKELTSNLITAQFTILPGLDAGHFTLEDPLGGTNIYTRRTLKMRGKDFENAQDVGSNNTYVVAVEASDGLGNATQQTITVTVTDTDDAVQFTETSDWIARMTLPPDPQVQVYMDTFVRKAITNGYWPNLLAFYLFAGSDQQAARLNAKGTTGTLTNNGALHIPYQGFRGDSAADYVEGIGLLALSSTLNKSRVGAFAYSLSDITLAGASVGFSNSSQLRVIPRNAAGKVDIYPLSATNVLVDVPDSSGLFGFQREGRGGFAIARGAVVSTNVGLPVEFPTGNYRFLSSNGTNFDNRIISAAGITEGMTQAKWLLFNQDLTQLITSIEAFLPAPPLLPRFTCNFDGEAGDTTAIDEGGGKTINFEGAAEISETSPLQGTGHLDLPSTGSFVWCDDSADWQMPRQFSMRARIKITNFGAAGHFSAIISHWEGVTNQRSWQFCVRDTKALAFFWSADGIASSNVTSAINLIQLNTQYEVMVDRDANGVIRLYCGDLDAVDTHANQVATGDDASRTFTGDFFDNTADMRIGDTDSNTNGLIGFIDSVLIWKNETICGSNAGYDPVTPPPPPGTTKKIYEQNRFPNDPDFSPYGIVRHEMAYASDFFPTGADRTLAPSVTFLRATTLPRLKSRWPVLTALAIDIETWTLLTGGSISGSGASAVFVPDAAWTERLHWHRIVIDELRVTHRMTVTGGSGTFINGETVTDGTRTGIYKTATSTSTSFGITSAASPNFVGTLTGVTSGATRTITSSALVGWPGVKLGYYGEFPTRDSVHLTGSPTVNVQRLAVWRSRNLQMNDCVDVIDFFMPSVYSTTSLMDDDLTVADLSNLWSRYCRDAIFLARDMDDGSNINPGTRPVIPAIWIEKRDTPTNTDTWNYEVMYEKLRVCVDTIPNGGADADGALFWTIASGSQPFFPAGGLAVPPNASVYSSIDIAEWWEATRDFVVDFGLD